MTNKKKPRTYWWLLEFEEDNHRWVIMFGDWDKGVTMEERDYYRRQGLKAKNLKIVGTSKPHNTSIQTILTELNRSFEF